MIGWHVVRNDRLVDCYIIVMDGIVNSDWRTTST